jgi:hypothetical protein
MSPELEPFRAPIRKVPADTRFISALVNETRLLVSLPRSNGLLLVRGANVTTPFEEVVATAAPRSTESAVTSIWPFAPVVVSELVVVNDPVVLVNSTLPEADT